MGGIPLCSSVALGAEEEEVLVTNQEPQCLHDTTQIQQHPSFQLELEEGEEASSVCDVEEEVVVCDVDEAVLASLCHDDAKVRSSSWAQVGKLTHEALSQCADGVVEQLLCLYSLQGLDAVMMLGALPSANPCPLLAAVSSRALQNDAICPAIATILIEHLKVEKGCQQMREARKYYMRSGSSSRIHAIHASPSGSSLLHLAAKAGNIRLVELLVKSGSRLHQHDHKGHTAADVARQCSHCGLADALQRLTALTAVRGGLGDALEEALQDNRRVVGVEWYVIRLEGFVRVLGGKHSLLAVTVARPGTDSDSHTYVVERARPGPLKGQQLHSGIFVSHWSDAAPTRSCKPRYVLKREDITSEEEMPLLTMRVLYETLLNQGNYDAVHCNAHNSASLLYNTCAAQHAKKPRRPNPHLRAVAGALSAAGFDLSSVERAALRHGMAKETKRFTWRLGGSERAMDLGMLVDIPWAAHENSFAACAVELSNWVYGAMMPGQEEAVVIENRSGEVWTIDVQETGECKELAIWSRVRLEAPFEELTLSVRDSKLHCLPLRRSTCLKVQAGTRYVMMRSSDGKAQVDSHSCLPQGVECQLVCHSEGAAVASWSLFTSSDTIWVAFRGTQSLVDAVVDLSVVSFDDADHGLRVQGCMWNALTQRKQHALKRIVAEVQKLQTSRPALEKLVFCGHSMGGGYAVMAGLYCLHLGMPVAAVIGFGSPQVVVPDRSLPIWQKLNDVTTVYVNNWDVIPRMPSFSNWLFDVLPRSLPDKMSISLGSLQIGLKAGGEAIKEFASHKGIFADYDHVGKVVFIQQGSHKVLSCLNTDEGEHRNILGLSPPEVGGFILDYHGMFQYRYIIAGLH
eukprot:TRINITY_DN43249_c0_g1_i1.p1 TRINITY_DN43249_c0_g1~~TRINITY_DN43249_c0_g1_i1.p1  ORF type:complete len:862 (+),score=171.86 TRINITY_DN43249_c0_g1_i1:23-2587(+)